MNEQFLDLDDLPKNGRVVIYGTGAAAKAVLERIRTQRPDITVPCLADSFRPGEAHGLPIVKRDGLSAIEGGFDLILIASAWWQDIGAGLDAQGIGPWAVAAMWLWHKYVFSDSELQAARPQLEEAEALLATEQDREIFRFLTECRRQGSPLVDTQSICPTITDYLQVRSSLLGHQQGQYLDFVDRKPIATMIHAGVFDGTDCLRFLEAFPNIKAIHGFDPQGIANIKPATLTIIEGSGRVHIHPFGLWNHSCSLPLASGGPVATFCQDDAAEQDCPRIQTVSIDEFVEEQGIKRIDYICLDVESAEQRVLDGARRTIKNHRPQLAVCIYHLKEDFFRLPLSMAEQLENYVFHLGHYNGSLNESVLYALPAELAD
ncbi:FkbM family methyltransferase [Pseudodesulfovibrio sp.]|uniref:FkbM family methyltransferase n=1 Tax=unclassified Pseudodesulfovibrio TaxID=2661612 RepID=UPI003B00C58C